MQVWILFLKIVIAAINFPIFAAVAQELRILHLDNDRESLRKVVQCIRDSRYKAEVQSITTRNELIRMLSQFKPDLLISEYTLPGFNGDFVIEQVRAYDIDLPILFLSDSLDEEKCLNILDKGAWDVISKLHYAILEKSIYQALREKVSRLQNSPSPPDKFKLNNLKSILKDAC